MTESDILEEIKTILREEDLEGFIRIGAPKDEYDWESSQIFERLKSYNWFSGLDEKEYVLWDRLNLSHVLCVVFTVITSAFSPRKEDSLPTYVPIAQRIYDVIQKYVKEKHAPVDK